jgi:hypothetical protein
MADDQDLTKVHVELPDHRAIGGESMWAADLGGDLYELRNCVLQLRALELLAELKPLGVSYGG